jgi:glycosyltransferase involved in cell wall biosynthesis
VKIVFLSPSGALGGAETALLDLLAALRAARPMWTLHLVTSARGPLNNRASALGISSTSLPFPDSLSRLGEWGSRRSPLARLAFAPRGMLAIAPALRYAKALRTHLRELNPDVVHTNGLKMHLLGARCRPSGARIIWHLHDYPDRRPLSAMLLRAHARRCSIAMANSDSVAASARRLFGSRVNMQTLHNAVDLERFRPEGARLDLDALAGLPSLPERAVRIGLLGTFARWKGHDVFLRALAAIDAQLPLRGYVIGAPIYQTEASQFSVDELRKLASDARLNGRLGFVGPVEDVPAALRSLDIVVHASVEPEPFGLVIAEAMACGRPVVVSKAGGAAEIAQGGALFHTPGDADDLASQLSRLASDPPLRSSLGKAGRAAALRLFERKRLSDTLIPIYEGL